MNGPNEIGEATLGNLFARARMNGKDDRNAGRNLRESLEDSLKSLMIVRVFGAVHGRENVLSPSDAETFVRFAAYLRTRSRSQRGIVHNVTDLQNMISANALDRKSTRLNSSHIPLS